MNVLRIGAVGTVALAFLVSVRGVGAEPNVTPPEAEATTAGATTAEAPVAGATTAVAAAAPIRRDPAGRKGISPFWERLSKGDAAYLARDFPAAVAAYREAITALPKNPLGHYRMGQAQVAKGDLAEAEAAYDAGLRFAESEPVFKAKLLFVVADLAERQKNYDQAVARWKTYAEFVDAKSESKGFAATATERQKRITEWVQISQQSAQVRERAEKRLQPTEPSKSP